MEFAKQRLANLSTVEEHRGQLYQAPTTSILQTHLHLTTEVFRNPCVEETELTDQTEIVGRWAISEKEHLAYTVYDHPIVMARLEGNDGDIPEMYIPWTAVRSPEASWRRAFVTQPPITSITYSTSNSDPEHHFRNDAGLTLGDFENEKLSLHKFDSEMLDGICEFMPYKGYFQLEALLSRPHKPWTGPRYTVNDEGCVVVNTDVRSWNRPRYGDDEQYEVEEYDAGDDDEADEDYEYNSEDEEDEGDEEDEDEL